MIILCYFMRCLRETKEKYIIQYIVKTHIILNCVAHYYEMQRDRELKTSDDNAHLKS